jgi:hypothetical protein
VEEKIEKAKIRKVNQRQNRKNRMNHNGENYIKKEPDKLMCPNWYEFYDKKKEQMKWLSEKIMEEENKLYESGSYKNEWCVESFEELYLSLEDDWLSRNKWKEKLRNDMEMNSYVPDIFVNPMRKWSPLIGGRKRKLH